MMQYAYLGGGALKVSRIALGKSRYPLSSSPLHITLPTFPLRSGVLKH